jgi:prepilin-type processing-associated H-X9-DG protein
MNRRAFTLTDLLILVAMAAILIGGLIPAAVCSTRESSNRIKCASNLRQIGLAMKMYANDEVRTNAYPRTIYEPDAPPVAYTNPDCPNPFTGANPPGPNDVTAAIFLTLRTQDITTDVFICPNSASDRFYFDSGKTIQDYGNFRSQIELSYSFQNPYPTKGAVSRGFVYNDSMTADFAIAADMNPGVRELLTTPVNAPGAQMQKLNSPNHDFTGQNVLYADGHAEWQASPFAGMQSDNIYTFGPNPAAAHAGVPGPVGIIGPPAGANDTILLPVWDATMPMPSPRTPPERIVWYIVVAAGVLLLIVGVTVYASVSRKKSAD